MTPRLGMKVLQDIDKTPEIKTKKRQRGADSQKLSRGGSIKVNHFDIKEMHRLNQCKESFPGAMGFFPSNVYIYMSGIHSCASHRESGHFSPLPYPLISV